MSISELLWRFVMQIKKDLSKSFYRAARRTAVALMLTVGIITPTIMTMTSSPPALAQTQVTTTVAQEAAPAKAEAPYASEIVFAPVTDLDQLVKDYPATSEFREALRTADSERLAGLKEINEEKSFYPGQFQIGTYKDEVNKREFVFVHVLNAPNMCAMDGCALTVYLKDGKDFRQVLRANSEAPIRLVSNKDDVTLKLPASASGPGLDMKFNAKTDQFEYPGTTPAPAPAPAPPGGPR